MSSTNKTSHYNLPQFIGSDIPTWLGDFNSAMTAIDSGINAAATAASGAATTAAQASTDAAAAASAATAAYNAAAAAQKAADNAANRCPFPIGYGGFFQTDPNSIYAGTTWEQKKDVFILASGIIYGAGSTGGEAQHTLTVEEIAKHEHRMSKGIGYKTAQESHMIQAKKDVAWADQKNDDLYYWWSYTEASGGSQPHNNMPPYYSMPFWIRTA